MNKDEVLKMAIIKAQMLKQFTVYTVIEEGCDQIIQACKEALEQPNITYEQGFAHGYEAHRVEQELEQPAQEPFGYFTALPFGWTDCGEDDEGAIALYEHPAPSWQGLSDDEILEIDKSIDPKIIIGKGKTLFARAIEQALKEKNT